MRHAEVAQLVEHSPEERGVTSSNLVLGTKRKENLPYGRFLVLGGRSDVFVATKTTSRGRQTLTSAQDVIIFCAEEMRTAYNDLIFTF